MTTRRDFMAASALATFGITGGGLARLLAQDRAADAGPIRRLMTDATIEAIDTSLAVLVQQQHVDGSFGTGPRQGSVAITGLCGLAFMSAGYQPGRGRYGDVVSRAIDYVLRQESNETPGYLANVLANPRGPMYCQGFGTLFLAECHGMVHQAVLRDRLRDTLGRAVKLIIDTQNREGGWRYLPQRADADLSVTICQMMALRAARNAGFSVPRSVADRCIQYVKECQDLRDTGGFRYQSRGGPAGFARTAAGVVALYSAGLYDDESVRKGLRYLERFKPGPGQEPMDLEYSTHYFYGHYYAAQAMWIAGERTFRDWYPAIRNELLTTRTRNGTWEDRIDRNYATAMALIILQIPNNYLPIMQR